MEPQKVEVKKQEKEEKVVQVGQEGVKNSGNETGEVDKNETGQLSKNEKKRREKAEKLAKEKAEKQLLKNKNPKEENENKQAKKEHHDLDPSQYYQIRSNVIKQMKKSPQTNPYPHKFEVKYSIDEFVQKYGPITKDNQFLQEVVTIAGRVTNIRGMSKNLIFYDLKGANHKLQVMCNAANHQGPQLFQKAHNIFRRGDIIGVIGRPGRTKTHQLSIAPGNVILLSPCLHMLPEAHVGLKDPQTRYRKRYLDLIMNQKSRDTFVIRSKVIQFVRKYLNNLNFLEVQTPMMNMIPGGASARPFITHHNDLNMKLYMRIAPELFLKQCVVGGLERVFEIGKNFRNQSIDQTHNPEYTSCQFYMAYADYQDLLTLTQDLLSKMVKEITGSFKIKIHPEGLQYPDKALEIDFTPPWRRISMMQQLEKCLKAQIPKDISTEEARQFFDKQCHKHHVACSNPRTTCRLIDKLVGHFLQSQCLNPTFIMEHPQMMSPLAKYHRTKPGLTERFELFIKYHEFCNAYTQLNDPFTQKELFMDQVKEKEKGDDESMFYDQTFVNALQHALPPTAGWGLGIDRTVMLLADQVKIQQVLLFPAMKPIEEKKEEMKPQQKKEEVKAQQKQ